MDVRKTVIKQYNDGGYDNIIPTAKTNNVLMQNNDISVDNVDECMDYLSDNISQTGRIFNEKEENVYMYFYNPLVGGTYKIDFDNQMMYINAPNGETYNIGLAFPILDIIYYKGAIYFAQVVESDTVDTNRTERERGISRLHIAIYKQHANRYDFHLAAEVLADFYIYAQTNMYIFRHTLRLLPTNAALTVVLLSTRLNTISTDTSNTYTLKNTISSYFVYEDATTLLKDERTFYSDRTSYINELMIFGYYSINVAMLKSGVYIIYSRTYNYRYFYNKTNPYYFIFYDTVDSIIIQSKRYNVGQSSIISQFWMDNTTNMIYYINKIYYTYSSDIYLSLSYFEYIGTGLLLSYKYNNDINIDNYGDVSRHIYCNVRNMGILNKNEILVYKKKSQNAYFEILSLTDCLSICDNNNQTFTPTYADVYKIFNDLYIVNGYNRYYNTDVENYQSCHIPIKI